MVVHVDRLKPYYTTTRTTEGAGQGGSQTNVGTSSTGRDSTRHSQPDVSNETGTNLPTFKWWTVANKRVTMRAMKIPHHHQRIQLLPLIHLHKEYVILVN